MIECLQQLKSLEIVDCNSIQLIIFTEEPLTKEDGNRDAISFLRLNSLKLKRLHNLIGFCLEDYIVEFQSLNILEIAHCPELKGFTANKTLGKDIATGSSTYEVLFNEKVAFPSLEKMTISHLRNVKSLWHNQLHHDSFCNLKMLKVEYCDGLLNVFSSSLLGVFSRRLEMLTVNDCASLEQVFELQGLDVEETCVLAVQLKELGLFRLPKLKHVWSKDLQEKYSFQNLRVVQVGECLSLKSLFPFSIAKGLLYLEILDVDGCGVEEIVSEKITEGLQQDIRFEFCQLSFLALCRLPKLKCFYPGVHTIAWPLLEKFKTYGCEKIKIFENGKSEIQPLFLLETDIPPLREVFFSSHDIEMICDGQQARDIFAPIKSLGITSSVDKSIVFLFCFLQKFHNLQMLELFACVFKELSPYEGDAGEEEGMIWTLPKIKKLKLHGCYMIWKQDSRMDHIYASLETLEVWHCSGLVNLAPASSSFQNLTYLDVCHCKEMAELIVSSTAQSLGCLVIMIIRQCKMMTEIVASEGPDEATYEIIFRELKYLQLDSLQNLKSFCSGNHTFKFPSLEQVYVCKCPRLKSFCEGTLLTPKLQVDLNATIEQLHQNKTGFHGLEQLKFSEFPELMEIWSRNPQEMLDFENLEFLEVCNSDNLSCIFSLPMALSLGRLQHLEIKRCSKMEQVVKETEGSVVEEAAKADNKIIIMFPLLKSILIESCPDLTSFYLGSAALEFPSLETIQVADCPKMATFVSASARDELMKEAIIGEETETSNDDHHTPAFFCNKLVLPKLENLKISSVGIVRIWQHQLPRGSYSFPNLTSFIIEGCNDLKHVLSFSMIECLQQLKSLEIVDCNSIQLIIFTEEPLTKEDGNRDAISFLRLNSLKLKRLHNLIGFCLEDYIVEFQSLNILEIAHCPELKGFTANKTLGKDIATGSSTYEVLFNEKVAFPSLEKMTISHLRNVKSLWHNQLHHDSFCNLKMLKVEYCDGLLNVFSSSLLGVFSRRLEMLTINDCASLEQVFELQGSDVEETCVLAVQLRELGLFHLSKLKHVWSKDLQGKYSFQNLRVVKVGECLSLKSLFPFSIAKGLLYLEILDVDGCGVEEIVSEKITEGLQQDIRFEFCQLSLLTLWRLPELKCFYPGVHTTVWPELKKLKTWGCEKIKIFGNGKSDYEIQQPLFLVETDIPQLEEVYFTSDDIAMICDGKFASDTFAHIKSLGITGYLDESIVFPFCFLQKFHNLQMLDVVGCNFKELSPYESDSGEEEGMSCTLPKIKKLKLAGCYKITQLWKQDSSMDHICASLETFEVWNCQSLINLASTASSFQNLTYLDVWDCKEMTELIVFSKAQSLGCLVTMIIRQCEMMTEIVASEGADEATYEIIFKELKYLEFDRLQNLKSFCSGNHTFKFPSLEQIYVNQCPRLKSFCEGASLTPKLQRVYFKETDVYKGHWAGDLNATIEQLHEKKA